VKKIAVLTSVVGVKVDKIYDIEFDNADYYFFTDNPTDIKGWTVRPLYPASVDDRFRGRRAAKIPKMLSHLLLPEYDYYIWHDYTNYVGQDPQSLVDQFLDGYDCAFFLHPERDSWHTEIKACEHRDHPERIAATERFMSNFKKHDSFFECSTFMRKNNAVANTTFGLWYEMMTCLSSRDQLTLPAAIQTHNPKINIMDGHCGLYAGNNEYLPANKTGLAGVGLVP